MLRYFLISYVSAGLHGHFSLRVMDTFPSLSELTERVRLSTVQRKTIPAIVITSVYEFRDEADYLAFRGETSPNPPA